MRAPTGAESYARGHLPGAVHVDYATDLHDPATPYAARVAPPERFAQVVGALGIDNETTVVAYDEGDVPYAARIVWMFRYYGHDRVRVMAGGYRAWTAAGMPVTQAVPAYAARTFYPARRTEFTRDAGRSLLRRHRGKRCATAGNAARQNLRAARPRHRKRSPPFRQSLTGRRARRPRGACREADGTRRFPRARSAQAYDRLMRQRRFGIGSVSCAARGRI